MTWPVWSPDAVARSRSSGEKARSSIALECGLKVRYAFENSGFAFWSVSRSRTPPSSSPMATREFATENGQLGIIIYERVVLSLQLQLVAQKGIVVSCWLVGFRQA